MQIKQKKKHIVYYWIREFYFIDIVYKNCLIISKRREKKIEKERESKKNKYKKKMNTKINSYTKIYFIIFFFCFSVRI
jgi:hypothetical protein